MICRLKDVLMLRLKLVKNDFLLATWWEKELQNKQKNVQL